VCHRCDLVVAERSNAMSCGSCLTLLIGVPRVFQRLSGMLVPRQVILFAVLLFGGTVGMCRSVVQFCGSLMVFVMRSVVKTSGHG
jgi:hypothetical protein